METAEFLQLHIRTKRRPCARDQLTGARQGSLGMPFQGKRIAGGTSSPTESLRRNWSQRRKVYTHATGPRGLLLFAALKGAITLRYRPIRRVHPPAVICPPSWAHFEALDACGRSCDFRIEVPLGDARSRPCGLQRRNKTSLACIKTGWPRSGRVARPSRHFSLWARTPPPPIPRLPFAGSSRIRESRNCGPTLIQCLPTPCTRSFGLARRCNTPG